MTPQTYLMGKVTGLVMHLLPIVVTPCITMMAVGCFIIVNPNLAAVTDQVVGINSFAMLIILESDQTDLRPAMPLFHVQPSG